MICHNNLNQKRAERGYIALVSVLLISITLLVLTVSVSLGGFYARSNIFGSEVKEQSTALAEGCVNKAIADVAVGSPTVGTVSFGTNPFSSAPYTCDIVAVQQDTPSLGKTTIKAHSTFLEAHTNLVVEIDSATQQVTKWREYPVMP